MRLKVSTSSELVRDRQSPDQLAAYGFASYESTRPLSDEPLRGQRTDPRYLG